MLKQLDRDLYQLHIRLPGNPLKALNSYIITGNDRSLIIDTGFNMPECWEDLSHGIKALGLDMKQTDILATHLHADHTGLIAEIISEGTRVFMGRADKSWFEKAMLQPEESWREAEDVFTQEGYPYRELQETRRANPAKKYVPSKLFDIVPLDEGDIFHIGARKLSVLSTPGHTPGHVCLYDREHKLMITGDHLLFDITPNITSWIGMPDSLGSYLESLGKMLSYDVQTVLTGHRGNEGSYQERIHALLQHHQERLNNVLDIVSENPHCTAYDVASRMKWSIRAKNWEEFPPGQRWFAVGEAVSHIDHLVLQGKLLRQTIDGINVYQCASHGRESERERHP